MRATAHRSSCGYDLIEVDADGIGNILFAVAFVEGTAKLPMIEAAARLLVIARNMPGGWERATELCRAESVRHQGE